MKKKLTIIALSAASTLPVLAGGLVHNTNHNAAFLRQFSQDAIIDITGLYLNPAGTAFLADGWHVSLNVQNATQDRDVTTAFPLMALNTVYPGESTRKFHGHAYAPVIPSFQLSYNHGKWSVNANFSIGGGGGKCEFDSGLGTFEALYAAQLYSQVPQMVNAQAQANVTAGLQQLGYPAEYAQMLAQSGTYNGQLTGYSLNAYMKGREYQFGLTLGGTYKVLDNLAVSLGVRAIYSTSNYNGWVQDIKASYAASVDVPANAALNFPGMQSSDQGTKELDEYAISLNTDRTGWGFSPIIGIDWRINQHWNVAARYEFKTRLRLENKSEMNDYTKALASQNEMLGQFADGAKVAADVPSILGVGVQYSPISSVRLMAAVHSYGDKNATRYGDTQKLIDDDELEFTAGVEWDCCKWVTLSGSWQYSDFGTSDAFMNDVAFDLDSNNMGLGARVNVNEHFNIDLGWMLTFYKDREVTTQNYLGSGLTRTDLYSRNNHVLGIGLNFKF